MSKRNRNGGNKRLGRNAHDWKSRHPGKSEWRTVPPIPGTRLKDDLYVAKIKPGNDQGYGVFASKRLAEEGDSDNALTYYANGDDMHAFVSTGKYAEEYTFHVLDKLRPSSTNIRRSLHGRFRP